MSEVAVVSGVPAAASLPATVPVAAPPAAWPAGGAGAVSPPLTQAMLANACARAAASNSRRDLVEYLRLRRKSVIV